MNWKESLRSLGHKDAGDFENFAEAIDEHLMNVVRELGGYGVEIDRELALSELAQAATMVGCLRTTALKIARDIKDGGTDS